MLTQQDWDPFADPADTGEITKCVVEDKQKILQATEIYRDFREVSGITGLTMNGLGKQ